MLILDKARALGLIIANSEQVSVPEPYRLAPDGPAGAVVAAAGPSVRASKRWAGSEAVGSPSSADVRSLGRSVPALLSR